MWLALLLLGCPESPSDTAKEGDSAELNDADGDGYATADGDCDDGDESVSPAAVEACDGRDNDCDGVIDEDLAGTYYQDRDDDGFGDPETAQLGCEGEGVQNGDDCDDQNATIYLGAPETCDGIDQDCDGEADNGVTTTFYADADGDGFGDPGAPVEACEQLAGLVADATDCDDSTDASFPGNPESCDERDNDCDGAVDEDVQSTFFEDRDGDGYGRDDETTEACAEPTGYASYSGDCDDDDPAYNPGADESDCSDPADYNCDGSTGFSDLDGDGYAACEECDDGDEAIFPGAEELCNDLDDNCDGDIDEESATDARTWYLDYDGDSYGSTRLTEVACDAPTDYVANASDCDDTDASVSPAATEYCNGTDDDCDGSTDEDSAADATTWYVDYDGDGYGATKFTDVACDAPADYVANASDCDDTEASVYPGATEACDDIDNDCDGDIDEDTAATTWYIDYDGDGYGSSRYTVSACEQPANYVDNDDDCDDTDSGSYPGASDGCDDADNDCDGTTDEDATFYTWYLDADGDGYGDPSALADACDTPANYVSDATDCDDSDGGVNPAATETCDGLDNDCDGTIDETGSTTTYYEDSDGDGYGSSTTASVSTCSSPSGYAAVSGDCDDSDASASPAATETCDGIDNDCDGTVDSASACGCDVETYSSNGHTYLFCDTSSYWSTASSSCSSMGYHLVTMNDSAENAWVTSYTNTYMTSDPWIGFNDRSSEGSWVWETGETVSYTNWSSSEPNNSGDEDCAHLYDSGAWNDHQCSGLSTGYICESY